MEVFVVINEDRHRDIEVEIFSLETDAIKCAKEIVVENREFLDEELNDSMKENDWLYYCQYSEEDDFVYVQKKTIR